MLLYDRLLEWAHHQQRRYGPDLAARCPESVGLLSSLRQAAVYELSSVMPLLQDWEREKEKKVPKRPPHPVLWAEWDLEEPTAHGPRLWKVGDVTEPMDLTTLPPVGDLGDRWFSETLHLFLAGCEEAYIVRRFYVLLRDPDPNHPLPGPLPLVCEAPFCLLWGMRDGSTDAAEVISGFVPKGDGTNVWVSLDEVFGKQGGVWEPFFGLCTYNPLASRSRGGLERSRYHPLVTAWPAFMAFALLHCHNVVAEAVVPDERTQRRVQKAGNPRRATYKVLKIEVPADCHRRQDADGLGDDDGRPKVRFHLCSGHFKHLQSERYVNKRGQWVWCPAHWKGSRALGRVDKRYELSPADAGGSA
jgi:hypothetical protein